MEGGKRDPAWSSELTVFAHLMGRQESARVGVLIPPHNVPQTPRAR